MTKLWRITKVAEEIERSLATTYNLASAGELPPPVEKVGCVSLYDPEDIRFYKATRIDRRTKEFRSRKRPR